MRIIVCACIHVRPSGTIKWNSQFQSIRRIRAYYSILWVSREFFIIGSVLESTEWLTKHIR